MHPDDIRKIHIADLRTKFGNQGLDITGESCHNVGCNVTDVVTRDWWWGVMSCNVMVGVEMRAIYASLPLDFDNDGDGKKVGAVR